ncbi:hypothetical protein FJTKL_11190 [Diaporthe vaccinii]|uniref:PD-(D/E)XK nuclease-like domain-containing protein n=1 Tax=Diaporthe vaccinii TaxID=105482 RepID=A0ABR4EIB9_9PEZI
MSPSPYPSNKSESPRSSPPCLQQRSRLDEGKSVGQGATVSTPSNTSSLISSVGSPSDRTSETNLDSPCSRDLNSTHLLSPSSPTDLLESLTQTISILWQIRAAGGPVNYHHLAHLDRSFRQDSPRIELPLSHTAYNILCCLLRLGDFAGVASLDEAEQGVKIQGKDWSLDTEALRGAAASIVWASKQACALAGRAQHFDSDSEGPSQNPELSPQTLLVRLGRWVLDKLRLEYDYDDSIFVLRMPTFFHEKSSQDIAECLLAYIRRAVGDDDVDNLRFSSHSLPLTLDAEGGVNDESEGGGHTIEGRDADGGENDPAAVNASPRKNQYHPDAGIFEKASLLPGLILELGFSHPTHQKRAKKYIRGGNGHIRCVLLLNIDYRRRSDRLNHNLPPPRILLTAFRIDTNEDSWGVKQFIDGWDLRAASNEDGQLELPGDLISEHMNADPKIAPGDGKGQDKTKRRQREDNADDREDQAQSRAHDEPSDDGESNTPRPSHEAQRQRLRAPGGPSQRNQPHGSPTRRISRSRRQAQSDTESTREDPQQAQAIHYVGVLRQAPPLPPPESRVVSRTPSEFTTTSTATASTASTQGRRRAKSPVKSLANLPSAETPVYAQSLTDVQELQDDTARELCIGLRQIASGRRVVPGCLRAHVDAQIERLTGLEEDELEDKHVATNGEDDYDALLAELSTLCGIVKQTKRALQPGSNFAEPHWNERIHSRVLKVALEPQATKEPHVAFFNVTVAKIATGCIPADVKGVDLEAKMVDYCIVLCDEEVQNAARHTISAHLHLQSQPSSQFASPRPVRSINQTEYTPLHLCPISVKLRDRAALRIRRRCSCRYGS